jgi:hypothetical protein
MTARRATIPLAKRFGIGAQRLGAGLSVPVAHGASVRRLVHAAVSGAALPLGGCGLALVAFLVYLPSLGDFFAADDFVFLQAADRHGFGEYARRAITFPHAEPFDLETPFWRPLVDAYFFAWWHLFGLNPLPYHAANVALHAVAGLLVATLVWQTIGARVPGLLAGSLFVVMPTHDYAVTELLGAVWYLTALVAYAAFLRGGGRSPWLYAAALGAAALAFLSKQSSATVIVPLAGLALLLGSPHDGRAWRRRAVELLPFAALTIAFVTLIATQEYPRYAAAGWFGAGWHVVAHWWDYLRWLTFPFAEVTPASRQSLTGPLLLVSNLTALALLALVPLAWPRDRALLAAMPLWAVVAFAPYVSATRPIEPRYAYLATVPLCIALALLTRSAGTRLARRYGRATVLPALAAGIGLLALALAAETRDRQRWMHDQARAYERLFVEAPVVCGVLPAGSRIELAADPFLWDMYGGFSSMALNLLYRDVTVAPISMGSEQASFEPRPVTCVLRFSEGRYLDRTPSAGDVPSPPGG